jgi:hypothetical protein
MSTAQQPLISPRYRRLFSSWDYHGLKLDIYGTLDSDGAEVIAVTLPGSNVDLEVIVLPSVFDAAQRWIDKVLPEQQQEDRAEAKAERAAWARHSAQFATR